jgi:hypothetical protein
MDIVARENRARRVVVNFMLRVGLSDVCGLWLKVGLGVGKNFCWR